MIEKARVMEINEHAAHVYIKDLVHAVSIV